MVTTQRRRVVIVGAGIAGLTLASALDPARFDVTLVEAQPHRTSGAALGLWRGARAALSELGIDLDVERETHVRVHSLTGGRSLRVPSPDVAQVHRPYLMAALARAVPESVERLTEEVDDPVELGRRLGADLVVGADGVRSRVRGVVDARAMERRPTSWVTLRGIDADSGIDVESGFRRGVSAGRDSAVDEAREFWGRGRLFGDAPVAGGRYWFTAHRCDPGPEPLDPGRVLDDARAVFGDAAAPVRSTLAGADARGVLATRLWVAPPMRRYARGRFVVIGDAAHASLPNLARGASDAVIDAVTLAATLDRGGSLGGWQTRRLPPTQAARVGAGLVMRVATSGSWR